MIAGFFYYFNLNGRIITVFVDDYINVDAIDG